MRVGGRSSAVRGSRGSIDSAERPAPSALSKLDGLCTGDRPRLRAGAAAERKGALVDDFGHR
jgi:hypothetical protein